MKITIEQFNEVKEDIITNKNDGKTVGTVYVSDDDLGLVKVKPFNSKSNNLLIEINQGKTKHRYSEEAFKNLIKNR